MLSQLTNVHFVGIGGYGMSALAFVLVEKGYLVSGSDVKQSKITNKLEAMGAEIYYNHDKNHVVGKDLVVYSTAIQENNPELVYAKEYNIPLWHRADLLAYLFNEKYGIAISGAHGKTTTTSMLSLILEEGGEDPTCIIGGELANFGGNARVGDGKYLVAEACESDHSFLKYQPNIAVVTNIEADHLEHYGGNFDKLLDTYCEFLQNIKDDGKYIIYSECEFLPTLNSKVKKQNFTFGIDEHSDVKGTDINLYQGGSEFICESKENSPFTITLNVPGEHNVLNALAAISVALELGLDPQVIQTALTNFRGAKRRFTITGVANGVTCVDDYAHHPTEIEVTLKTARQQCEGRVIGVFQPHRYTRTQFLMDDFAKSFTDADLVILNSVYPAGEESIPGADAKTLKERIEHLTKGAEVILFDDMEDIVNYLQKIAEYGDYVVTMGAGDIWKVSKELSNKLAGENSNCEA